MRPARVLWATLAIVCYIITCACLFGAPAGRAASADPWFAEDKLMHAGAGAVIAAPVTLATGNEWIGWAAAAAAGIGKELADRRDPINHTASAKDAVWTIAGGLLGAKLAGSIMVSQRRVVVLIPIPGL